MTAPRDSLFQRDPNNPLLTTADWPYPANSVFNPAASLLPDGSTALLARVEELSGRSHLTVARSRDGRTDWEVDAAPTLAADPERHPEEAWGLEDPRVTWLEDRGEFAILYTAYSDRGPLIALATSPDLGEFTRHGPITAPENKDGAIFPEKIGGRYAMLHRPVSGMGAGAHVWIAYSPDLLHWGGHQVLMRARGGCWWDSGKIGANCPPLATDAGWLVLYHGVRHTPSGCLYRLGLALLDRENPERVLRRSPAWVMGPRERYEFDGDVGNVLFPCGWTLVGDELRIYYGAADTSVALGTASLEGLLDYLGSCPRPEELDR